MKLSSAKRIDTLNKVFASIKPSRDDSGAIKSHRNTLRNEVADEAPVAAAADELDEFPQQVSTFRVLCDNQAYQRIY